MRLTIRHFDLPLRRPFGISRGTRRRVESLVVALDQDGETGYGEATANEYYGATLENITAALEQVRPAIEAAVLADPAAFWARMQVSLAASPGAQCALDEAAHDLWGKLQGQPVWKLWGLSVADCPASSYTIGIDSPEVMVEKLREFADWPIFKIKLGTADDLAIVRRLREHTDAILRVDANAGWSADEAIRNAGPLAALGVEFVEQPLPPEAWDAMRRVFRESPLPLVADESCRAEGDVERCRSCFHGVNIKLQKCGGLTPARRMIDHARQLGLTVMVGCMTESTVGISAAAQLLPLVDYADIDGATLLAEDVATGVSLDRGRAVFPDAGGCGVRLL